MVDFKKIEEKWQKKWEQAKIFQVKEDKKKKKYFSLEMYPYPSSSGLHMGHALNYSIGDIYARFKRMNGYNVLYPMGFDSFGLPAENAAIKNKIHPKKFTDDAINNYIRQMKELGLSYDWNRILMSHDPNYYKWNQYFFLKFLEKRLAFRKKSSVNWCPDCKTVLANEQVHNGKCWRHTETNVQIKQLEQWFFKTTKYAEELLKDIDKLNWPERIKIMQRNWIGKSCGIEIEFRIEPEINKKMNCVIVHGSNPSEKSAKEGSPENERHWKQWLKKSLEKRGVKTSNELYPEDWLPDYDKWKKVFEKNTIDENTILVGHSAGAAFLLRWLGENKKKVNKLILIAPSIIKTEKYKNLKFKDFKYDSSLKNYFNELIIFCSDNDVKNVIESAKQIHSILDGDLIQLKGKGHFCFDDMGTEEFPELLDKIIDTQNWKIFTTRPDTLFGVTFMVVSAQHYKLMNLVTEKQKKQVEDFLKKIKSTKEEDIDKLEKEGVFTGAYAEHPLTKEKIPVYTGNFVLAEYGSGMVMAVPAHDQRDFEFAKKYNLSIKIVIKSENSNINEKSISKAYEDSGILINSKEFNGLKSEEAKEKITKVLENKNLGKKSIQYKLRDWLISRQRYWGTPIPIIYCDKCGITPVPEKDLPVLLPEKVKFGEGNPLETNKEFVNVKCSKCKGNARRETDTMDTFVDSSWYFLRYTDNKNNKKPFDKEKAQYWMPVDQYIGGAEHAVMHLIYARFFTKALRDLGFINLDEPFPKLFNQGMLHKDGFVMSKSRGNVILPEVVSKKYGIDTARLFLVSIASPDKDTEWSDKGVEGSLRFINKIFDYSDNVKFGKTSKIFESKLHKAIKEITDDLENFRYNYAVIKIRELFESREEEINKKDLEIFVKLLAPFCPHIAEELWEKLGNKNFISLEKWPISDKAKIDERLEEQQKNTDKLIDDIKNILKILKEKGKEAEKIYIYVLPKELELYNKDYIEKKIEKNIEIFSVSDKKKYDPENKSIKAKPGKPALYVE